MTWTYTTPWGDRDLVRFLVQDTDASSPIFTDEELDSLLSYNSSDPRLAAASALESLAGKYARSAIRYSIPGLSLDRTMTAQWMLKRAEALRAEAAQIPFEFQSVVDHYVDEQGFDRSNYPNTPSDWP